LEKLMSVEDTPQYLLYVVGKDANGKPRMLPVAVNASGADLQRKKHVEVATEIAKKQGVETVSEVFFADAVYAAVDHGLDMQGDASTVCVDLHNEHVDKTQPVNEAPEVNDALWRIAESSLGVLNALPPESKVRFIESLGSNQPSWSRAVYGVFKTDPASGKRYVEKLPVEDLGRLKELEKAGMNIELFLRILSKIGILESVLSTIEKRVSDLARMRKRLKLNDRKGRVKSHEIAKTSTKNSDNQKRGPF
jgi:hypothetical protein